MQIPDLVKIGNRIRQYRKAKHLTQEQVAEMLDISPSSYGRFERGIGGIQYERFVQLTEILDLDLNYVVRGEYKTDNPICDEYLDLLSSIPANHTDDIKSILDALRNILGQGDNGRG